MRGSRSGRGNSSSTGGSAGSECDLADATDGGGAGRDMLRVIVWGMGMEAGGMTLWPRCGRTSDAAGLGVGRALALRVRRPSKRISSDT
ncbi:Hypothetical protein PHPALM_37555 [Phytophthora palmivora]|uniref:Uncharacterized protein n=1 Tax=Phytophthora palmivora TaxID=4796 RepID=A0A2P4WX49_9STRA|nr:Hypothetical protein PHPALM_37555 [Phytophthora palmivora]